jgi:NAD(P)H-flavin reductase
MTAAASLSPADPWTTQTVRIAEIIPEITDVATYRLIADDPGHDAYRFQPGQFNMLYLPGVGESAISMSGDPGQSQAWIHTVRIAGNVTQTLAELNCGDTLGLRGPFGTGWPVAELQGRDVIVVAGGLGLAPLRPLIYHIVRHRGEFGQVRLLIGARTPDGLLFSGEFDDWRSERIDVQVTVDRAPANWTGHIGVVTAILDRLPLAIPSAASLVSCGPEVMMKYVARSGLQRGLPANQMWVSMERNMQCAVGLCGHCQWGREFICKDGPVLRYDRIQSYFSLESL